MIFCSFTDVTVKDFGKVLVTLCSCYPFLYIKRIFTSVTFYMQTCTFLQEMVWKLFFSTKLLPDFNASDCSDLLLASLFLQVNLHLVVYK